MTRTERENKDIRQRAPRVKATADGKCGIKACPWPVYKHGRCLQHLREMGLASSPVSPPQTVDYELAVMRTSEMKISWH